MHMTIIIENILFPKIKCIRSNNQHQWYQVNINIQTSVEEWSFVSGEDGGFFQFLKTLHYWQALISPRSRVAQIAGLPRDLNHPRKISS